MAFPSRGSVVWIEIDTTDAHAVQDFYGSLFGWSFPGMPAPDGGTYHLIQPAGAAFPMGGILENRSGGRGGIVLSAVSLDVADDVARLKDLGATVVVPPSKAADGGDYARLKDPRGNLFAIWTPRARPRARRRASTPGRSTRARSCPSSARWAGSRSAPATSRRHGPSTRRARLALRAGPRRPRRNLRGRPRRHPAPQRRPAPTGRGPGRDRLHHAPVPD
ncbi:VOC family protein [Streptomyces albulus]|nr:VOC family protein [Streptomyces noursei]